MISNLRMVGYDYAISIEHEDSLMSQDEGLSKAVDFLKNVLITQNTAICGGCDKTFRETNLYREYTKQWIRIRR